MEGKDVPFSFTHVCWTVREKIQTCRAWRQMKNVCTGQDISQDRNTASRSEKASLCLFASPVFRESLAHKCWEI